MASLSLDMGLRIEGIRVACADGSLLTAEAEILGAAHEIMFIRVEDVDAPLADRPEATIQRGVGEAGELYDTLMSFGQRGSFETVQVPGIEGEFVVMIQPRLR